jgi:hypothetical protein
VDWIAGRIHFHGELAVVAIYLFFLWIAIAVGYNAISHTADAGRPVKDGTNSIGLVLVCCTILVASTIAAAVGMRQALAPELESLYVLRPSQGLGPGRASGSFGQPNHLATVLAMGIAAAGVVFELRVINKTLLLVFWAMFLVALAMTASRTGALAVFILSAVAMYPSGSNRLRASRLALVALVCALIAAYSIHRHWVQEFFNAAPKPIELVSTRLELWGSLLPAVLAKPWLGWGWLSTTEAQASFVHASPIVASTGYGHGFWLDFTIWFGIPISLLLIVLLLFAARKILTSGCRVTVFSLCLLIPFVIHSLVEFPYAYAYFLLPAGVLFGMAWAGTPHTRYLNISWRTVFFICVLSFGCSAILIQQYLAVAKHIEQRRFVEQGVGELAPPIAAADGWLWDQLVAFAVAIQDEPRRGLSSSELAAERATRMRFPTRGNMVRYAVTLAINGQVDAARAEIDIVKSIGPHFWPVALGMLCDEAKRGKPEVSAALSQSPQIECAKP